jgi:DNA-damage-inducible protein D
MDSTTNDETRNKLTDYWKEQDIKESQEFAIPNNLIHQEWTDLTVNIKILKV